MSDNFWFISSYTFLFLQFSSPIWIYSSPQTLISSNVSMSVRSLLSTIPSDFASLRLIRASMNILSSYLIGNDPINSSAFLLIFLMSCCRGFLLDLFRVRRSTLNLARNIRFSLGWLYQRRVLNPIHHWELARNLWCRILQDTVNMNGSYLLLRFQLVGQHSNRVWQSSLDISSSNSCGTYLLGTRWPLRTSGTSDLDSEVSKCGATRESSSGSASPTTFV